jgi:hypothetical protein
MGGLIRRAAFWAKLDFCHRYAVNAVLANMGASTETISFMNTTFSVAQQADYTSPLWMIGREIFLYIPTRYRMNKYPYNQK